MSNSFYHKYLTDAQWNVFNAIMWILKSGARWRDLPARYGNWNSIYHKFRRRCSLGLFERLLQLINADVRCQSSRPYQWENELLKVILTGGQIRLFIAEHGVVDCIPDKANLWFRTVQTTQPRWKIFSANQELPSHLYSLWQIGFLFWEFRFTRCLCYSLLIYQQPLVPRGCW